MRGASILRNAAQAATQAAAKPKPMSADHTLYHLQPTGFWKKFRDVLVVNPEISSGLPLQDKHRMPPPASRTERYATPATAASDVAFNQYYDRDTRRAYPQTSVVTQTELSELLLASPTLAAVEAPKTEVATEAAPLTAVLAKLPEGTAFVAAGIQTGSATGLPPTPPSLKDNGKWEPKAGAYIPRAPYQYFPMVGYV
ncbi:NADH-ubiquinone oxidoreductase 21 subunit [Vanrija pseudolonga]|uniref:NADH-ubiquinone oxidoreductase 21 subunit n=1 Tax=Vanrija pseudolonga TaxID=143232 RepID=A0AAF1BQV3_9TREE|nr:NADH-ubiquinone oxidoreductase 21 subunit [Vanrija pseudolonga]